MQEGTEYEHRCFSVNELQEFEGSAMMLATIIHVTVDWYISMPEFLTIKDSK